MFVIQVKMVKTDPARYLAKNQHVTVTCTENKFHLLSGHVLVEYMESASPKMRYTGIPPNSIK